MSDYVHYYILPQLQLQRMAAVLTTLRNGAANDALPTPIAAILLQAVVVPGPRVPEGQAISAVAPAWFEILELFKRDSEAIYKLDWRQWEEFVAGAYRRQGFEVVLTPRSRDKGRDVIASRKDIGQVRFFDQVKAYAPNHLVTLEEVHAMLGVLSTEPNVSKGIITTTSTFAPGVLASPEIARFLPYRLELKDKHELLVWLSSLAGPVGSA